MIKYLDFLIFFDYHRLFHPQFKGSNLYFEDISDLHFGQICVLSNVGPNT